MPQITASAYNNIRQSIAGRVGNQAAWADYPSSLTTPLTSTSGYGRSFASSILSAGSTVTSQQYFNLWSDLQAAHVHQTGALATDIDPDDFEQGVDRVVESHITDLNTIATSVLAFNHAATDFPASNFDGPTPLETSGGAATTSTRNTSFGGSGDAVTTITHEVTVNFGTHQNFLYFLTSGGEIRFAANASGGNTAVQYTKDWDWAQVLADAGQIRFGRVNQTTWRCDSVSGTGTGYSNAALSTGAPTTVIFSKQGGGRAGGNPGDVPVGQIYDDNFFRIYASTNTAFNTATQLKFKIELDDGDTGTGGQGEPGGPTGNLVDESVTATINSTVYTYTPASDFVWDGTTYNAISLPVPTGTKDSDF